MGRALFYCSFFAFFSSSFFHLSNPVAGVIIAARAREGERHSPHLIFFPCILHLQVHSLHNMNWRASKATSIFLLPFIASLDHRKEKKKQAEAATEYKLHFSADKWPNGESNQCILCTESRFSLFLFFFLHCEWSFIELILNSNTAPASRSSRYLTFFSLLGCCCPLTWFSFPLVFLATCSLLLFTLVHLPPSVASAKRCSTQRKRKRKEERNFVSSDVWSRRMRQEEKLRVKNGWVKLYTVHCAISSMVFGHLNALGWSVRWILSLAFEWMA